MGISLFLHIDRNFGTRVPNKLGSVSHNITVMAPGYLEKGLCQARFGTQVKLSNLTRTSPPLLSLWYCKIPYIARPENLRDFSN
jgi:hypothetical protein